MGIDATSGGTQGGYSSTEPQSDARAAAFKELTDVYAELEDVYDELAEVYEARADGASDEEIAREVDDVLRELAEANAQLDQAGLAFDHSPPGALGNLAGTFASVTRTLSSLEGTVNELKDDRGGGRSDDEPGRTGSSGGSTGSPDRADDKETIEERRARSDANNGSGLEDISLDREEWPAADLEAFKGRLIEALGPEKGEEFFTKLTTEDAYIPLMNMLLTNGTLMDTLLSHRDLEAVLTSKKSLDLLRHEPVVWRNDLFGGYLDYSGPKARSTGDSGSTGGTGSTTGSSSTPGSGGSTTRTGDRELTRDEHYDLFASIGEQAARKGGYDVKDLLDQLFNDDQYAGLLDLMMSDVDIAEAVMKTPRLLEKAMGWTSSGGAGLDDASTHAEFAKWVQYEFESYTTDMAHGGGLQEFSATERTEWFPQQEADFKQHLIETHGEELGIALFDRLKTEEQLIPIWNMMYSNSYLRDYVASHPDLERILNSEDSMKLLKWEPITWRNNLMAGTLDYFDDPAPTSIPDPAAAGTPPAGANPAPSGVPAPQDPNAPAAPVDPNAPVAPTDGQPPAGGTTLSGGYIWQTHGHEVGGQVSVNGLPNKFGDTLDPNSESFAGFHSVIETDQYKLWYRYDEDSNGNHTRVTAYLIQMGDDVFLVEAEGTWGWLDDFGNVTDGFNLANPTEPSSTAKISKYTGAAPFDIAAFNTGDFQSIMDNFVQEGDPSLFDDQQYGELYGTEDGLFAGYESFRKAWEGFFIGDQTGPDDLNAGDIDPLHRARDDIPRHRTGGSSHRGKREEAARSRWTLPGFGGDPHNVQQYQRSGADSNGDPGVDIVLAPESMGEHENGTSSVMIFTDRQTGISIKIDVDPYRYVRGDDRVGKQNPDGEGDGLRAGLSMVTFFGSPSEVIISADGEAVPTNANHTYSTSQLSGGIVPKLVYRDEEQRQ